MPRFEDIMNERPDPSAVNDRLSLPEDHLEDILAYDWIHICIDIYNTDHNAYIQATHR